MKIFYTSNKLDKPYEDLILNYTKRLKNSLELVRLKPQQQLPEPEARARESQEVIKRLPPDQTVVVLDENGLGLSSIEFARLVEKLPKTTNFVIGGSYGVSKSLIDKATYVLRLSDLVMPHQLALLVLIEQLYRAQAISTGHPYHHA
jgi:23S rRNA (pseudouridine1915-N3)-methyltransferase